MMLSPDIVWSGRKLLNSKNITQDWLRCTDACPCIIIQISVIKMYTLKASTCSRLHNVDVLRNSTLFLQFPVFCHFAGNVGQNYNGLELCS